MKILEFQSVSFAYGKKSVLDGLSFSLEKGEILAVMGPSGCGKSTLLQLIAGLQNPQNGRIVCHADRISYAFQEPRLFPWLTVAENLRAVVAKDEATDERIALALRRVGLSDAANLYPAELSGGMKSRASLARALVYGGDLCLFDEPFAALDEGLRQELAPMLRKSVLESGASALFVTHQRADAEAIADRTLEWK